MTGALQYEQVAAYAPMALHVPGLTEEEFLDWGARLGWLIDPETRSVSIYRPGRAPETMLHAQRAEGEGPVAGFVLELTPLWEMD